VLDHPERATGVLIEGDAGATRYSACGLVQPARDPAGVGPLDLLRNVIGGMDGLIGLLLVALLLVILGIWLAAPLSLARHLFREGDVVRGSLVLMLVASSTFFGVRAVRRRELGPAVAAVALMFLGTVAWAYWRVP